MNTYLKKKHLKKFNPNNIRKKGSLFGLPFNEETASIVVIPVPWDVTNSLNDGASLAPKDIMEVSPKIELHHPGIEKAWELGIAMLPIDEDWIQKNNQAREFAEQYIKHLEGDGIQLKDKEINLILKNINALSENINDWVYTKSSSIIESGQIPVVLGGEHSAPYGLMKALSEKHDGFGVLQIDARADLRKAFEGFNHSFASIMHNFLEFDTVRHLVQVGVREYSEVEFEELTNNPRISTYFDSLIQSKLLAGVSWSSLVDEIINDLPEEIYISLDIAGLEPSLCPNTGTRVPGGLTFSQLSFLFEQVARTGKRIIGFDLCEVSGNQDYWGAFVGSRILYYLSNITGVSNKLLHFR